MQPVLEERAPGAWALSVATADGSRERLYDSMEAALRGHADFALELARTLPAAALSGGDAFAAWPLLSAQERDAVRAAVAARTATTAGAAPAATDAAAAAVAGGVSRAQAPHLDDAAFALLRRYAAKFASARKRQRRLAGLPPPAVPPSPYERSLRLSPATYVGVAEVAPPAPVAADGSSGGGGTQYEVRRSMTLGGAGRASPRGEAVTADACTLPINQPPCTDH